MKALKIQCYDKISGMESFSKNSSALASFVFNNMLMYTEAVNAKDWVVVDGNVKDYLSSISSDVRCWFA
jgi:hypothetical protein